MKVGFEVSYQPRVLVIQDISASCRISMNVAVPILSCLNNEVSLLPTALLSTHTTSGFEDYTFLDLTDESDKILKHWTKLGLQFDGVLVGYLGSVHQIKIVQYVLDHLLKNNGKFILDPVMGDNGELYEGFDVDYVERIKALCKQAAVILPNITEASYLTGYHIDSDNRANLSSLIKKVAELNQSTAIITGVSNDEEAIGALSYDLVDQTTRYESGPYYPGHFEGSGDLFSSVVAGLMLNQKSVHEAMRVAVKYVNKSIKRTTELPKEKWRYGVRFETDIPYLLSELYDENEVNAEKR